jgi:hypothetical protein
VLAASYDALKAVDRSITVLGIGLGPRGTDNPRAPGNLSISPVRCIRDIGRAYRKSRRKKPIMDALSYHPYPNASTDKLETGYSWPERGSPQPRSHQAGGLGRVQRHRAADVSGGGHATRAGAHAQAAA